jgi:hypothetical protein
MSRLSNTRQADAIEVTPEMIKAGVWVLMSCFDEQLSGVSELTLERAVTEVCEGMLIEAPHRSGGSSKHRQKSFRQPPNHLAVS